MFGFRCHPQHLRVMQNIAQDLHRLCQPGHCVSLALLLQQLWCLNHWHPLLHHHNLLTCRTGIFAKADADGTFAFCRIR